MKRSNTISLILLSIFLISMTFGCNQPTGPAEFEDREWTEFLNEDLDLLGHRNWVLVVDKAFPEQSSPGMKYLYVEEDLNPVLAKTLNVIDESNHVAPVIFRDKELAFLKEEQVPGIGAFREESARILKDRPVNELLHNDVFSMLDESAVLFRVLVIKTNCTLPYTSVFIQLDCSYWGPEDEAILRNYMDKGEEETK